MTLKQEVSHRVRKLEDSLQPENMSESSHKHDRGKNLDPLRLWLQLQSDQCVDLW